MKKEELQEVLKAHKKWLNSEGGGIRADLSRADLKGADLKGADLKGADLRRVDLRGADLKGADLRGAGLRGADLGGADLRRTDLREADMRYTYLRRISLDDADLSDTNLSGADLSGADLSRADLSRACMDFASWPLWHGSLSVKVCKRIAVQLAYHFCSLDCDDPDYIKARDAILDFANQFHHVGECGKLLRKGPAPASNQDQK